LPGLLTIINCLLPTLATSDFFREYKRVFDVVMEKVQGFGAGEEEQEAKKLFVQTFFNRLMFVYFLSRKGWLTFKGDQDYLNALWKDYPARSEDKNFYSAASAASCQTGWSAGLYMAAS